MGGVPTFWRTLTADSRSEPAWSDVYASFDVLEPWPVGRYEDDAYDDIFRADVVAPDLALTSSRGQDYMPGIFPGFSWHNLFRNRGESWPLNQIPRRGGRFLWHQGCNLVDAGAKSIFVAMFDEVDEGTAIFKAAPTQAQAPDAGDVPRARRRRRAAALGLVPPRHRRDRTDAPRRAPGAARSPDPPLTIP